MLGSLAILAGVFFFYFTAQTSEEEGSQANMLQKKQLEMKVMSLAEELTVITLSCILFYDLYFTA